MILLFLIEMRLGLLKMGIYRMLITFTFQQKKIGLNHFQEIRINTHFILIIKSV